jgi:cytochrome o ubiquinol oxidase subunit IV
MSHPPHHQSEAAHGTIGSYVTGFVWSIGLTLAAYFTVVYQLLPAQLAIGTIMGLALVQLIVQLVFFLHLGRDSRPRWNAAILAFTVLIILILVIGSLWIMHNLNYHMMPAHEAEQRIIEREGITR